MSRDRLCRSKLDNDHRCVLAAGHGDRGTEHQYGCLTPAFCDTAGAHRNQRQERYTAPGKGTLMARTRDQHGRFARRDLALGMLVVAVPLTIQLIVGSQPAQPETVRPIPAPVSVPDAGTTPVPSVPLVLPRDWK